MTFGGPTLLRQRKYTALLAVLLAMLVFQSFVITTGAEGPRVALATKRTTLASFRTAQALDRTTLAWVRTTLTMGALAWAWG
jgi:hypothetical protein